MKLVSRRWEVSPWGSAASLEGPKVGSRDFVCERLLFGCGTYEDRGPRRTWKVLLMHFGGSQLNLQGQRKAVRKWREPCSRVLRRELVVFPGKRQPRAGELFLVYETMRTSHPARARNQPQLFRGPLGSFTNHTEEDDYFTNVYSSFIY